MTRSYVSVHTSPFAFRTPQPPSEEGEMACSSQQIHLPKKSRNLFGKEKLFIPPKEKKTFESSLVPFDRKARPSHSWLVIIDRPRLSLPVGK